jgi:hypothetical protein
MSYNKSELYRACIEVAENTLWNHKSPPSHDEIKSLADEFFEKANDIGEIIEDLCHDQNPIVHAVRYLAYTHAIPPMSDNTTWFYPMLEVLMELCCPNIIQSKDSGKFFYFLDRGINQSRSRIEIEVDQEEKGKIDELLDQLDPNLKAKRIGAWQTFKSDNPDRFSQAANSMVELLNQVISQLCKGSTFAEYLAQRFESDKNIKWVESTRKFIGDTKSNLHRIKNHKDYHNENMVETLLSVTERLIHMLLERSDLKNT